ETMTKMLLIGSDQEIIARVRHAKNEELSVVPLLGLRDADDLAKLMHSRPSVVLVEVQGDPAIPLALTSALANHYSTPVLMVSHQAAELGLPAMRAGARDILSPLASPHEYASAIDRAIQSAVVAANSAKTPAGRVITVASPKGGVGKTTVSTNIATGLAIAEPESTVIVDLDVQFGDVASGLNLTPEYTLPHAARAAAEGDALALKTYLARHETGLYVVAGSDSPAESDTVTPESATALISMLVESFRYVVVDTAPGLTDHTLAALDMANDLVLVTSLDVPGVRGMRMELDTLNQLGLLLDSRSIVINFNEPSRGLSISDVEATIGAKVDFVIPSTSVVPLSVNQGVPLLQSRGKDPVTKELTGLVERISGGPAAKPKTKRGLFSKWS
ncbi:MAG: hypothetical protein CSA83_02585, partial [Actinomycetales bacterium]